MTQAVEKLMASLLADIDAAVLLGDGGLLKLCSSTGYGQSVNGHRLILCPHHESETIGQQSADHLLNSASDLAIRKSRRNGIGRFRFDIVGLAKSPLGRKRKTRRGIDGYIVCVT